MGEAPIHQKIKERLASDEVDERSTTIVLGTLSNATRVFKNDVTIKIRELEDEGTVDFSKIAPFASGQRTKHMWQQSGDFNDAMWSCGQSAGLINDVPTCKELITRMVSEAEQQLKAASARLIPSNL